MIRNPFAKPEPSIKRRKNPEGEYAHLDTAELLDAVKKSAHSDHRADLDILLNVFLDRYQARQQELDDINHHLETRIQDEVNLREANHKLYEQQAKMAAMGEMMDAVAHQWKQPLNALSLMSDMLQGDFSSGKVTQAYIDEFTQDTHQQIDHMVTTLNEFRTFFRPKSTEESFGIKRCIQSVLILVNDEFMQKGINVHIQSEKEILIRGIENEFKHLVLNIINNSKDAFEERTIQQRDIYINFYTDDTHINLEIEDTAGGIPKEVIHNIFKPEVTTKPEGSGTGIGLYMSMQIAQKLGGSLSVVNSDKGARFLLEILINKGSF